MQLLAKRADSTQSRHNSAPDFRFPTRPFVRLAPATKCKRCATGTHLHRIFVYAIHRTDDEVMQKLE